MDEKEITKQKTYVEFGEEHEVGGQPTTVAHVTFRGADKDILVAFFSDVDFFEDGAFRFLTGTPRGFSGALCVNVFEVSGKEDEDLKMIASDVCVFRDPMRALYDKNSVGNAAKDWFTPTSPKYAFFDHLKTANFDGNSEDINNIIQFAQQRAIEAFPEYQKKWHLKTIREDKTLSKEEKKKRIEKERKAYALNKSKLGQLRLKMARKIDKRLGTDFEGTKLPTGLKKIEKALSDRLFGKVEK